MDMNKYYNTILKKIEGEIKKGFSEKITQSWIEAVAGQVAFKVPLEAYKRINQPAIELLNRGGKRWRPVLMLLCCELAGGREEALPLAPLVELAHNGSLIIDDIEDKADWRRGGKAVHLIYGEDMAINTGNFLYFLPTGLIDTAPLSADIKLNIYRYYTENMRRLHLGQGLDIQWHRDHLYIPSKDEYMQMCRFKTGSLARMAAQIGVTACGGSRDNLDLLGDICEEIGVAFQIFDDVINLTAGNPGKKRGDDIIEGKKSLPVILHVRNQPETERKLKMLLKSVKTKSIKETSAEIEETITLLNSSGSIDEAGKIAEKMLIDVRERLEKAFCDSRALRTIYGIIDNFIKAGE